MEIKFVQKQKLDPKPTGALGFGKYYTDYMLTADWSTEKGWHDAQIVPYGPIEFDPATIVLHYGQETFEGMKAYKSKAGEVLLFRPEMNAKRFANSNRRLQMPALEVDDYIKAVVELVKVEQDWIPTGEGESLYIRPFMYAYEAAIGVRPASNYKFIIILSPVGAYYPEGVNPVRIYVEEEFSRTAPGGTGIAKCGGNYAGSLPAQVRAAELGFTQVLWLDAKTKKNVEEVGAMNVMFLIGDTVVTPQLGDTILPGITRDSIIHLLKHKGVKVEERILPIEELMQAARDGSLKEAWGTGTAAVVSPIGSLYYRGEEVKVNDFKTGELTHDIYDTLVGIQDGSLEDPFGWRYVVK